MMDVYTVKKLIEEQFPKFAHLAITSIPSGGTDNSLFRLGRELVVRFPRFQYVAEQIKKEHQWLPTFESMLPLVIPTPMERGSPTKDYPWEWSIYKWIEGDNALNSPIADLQKVAYGLAQFIGALQGIDALDGPLCSRGVPLLQQDRSTRKAIKDLKGIYDTSALMSLWEISLNVPVYHGKPVWLHADLHGGNLLVRDGCLCAVIDFGMMGVGDPACDMMVAWTLLSAESRKVFRTHVMVDDATWERGRGWALSFGVIALAYYINTNPVLSGVAIRTIDEVLSDVTELS